jgi:transposase-like protein
MIKEVEVKVFEERLYCDKCGAEMEYSGLILCSDPLQYPYKCPSCGWSTTTLDIKYPNISYKPVNE